MTGQHLGVTSPQQTFHFHFNRDALGSRLVGLQNKNVDADIIACDTAGLVSRET